MQNSNEEIQSVPSPGTEDTGLSNAELEQVRRRLDVSKGFFAWTLVGYFLSTLFTVGGFQVATFTVFSKWLLGVMVFGCGAFAYAAYAHQSALGGRGWYKTRFIALLVIAVICAGGLLRSYGLL